MNGDERRKQILDILMRKKEPVPGGQLAKLCNVSRQVIVQDIALLRAENRGILSTNKGYVLYQESTKKVRRIFPVNHTTDQIKDELDTMVEYGGRILDVVIEHDIYGQITVDLDLATHKDVSEFVSQIAKKRAKPLKELTGGLHYHTVEADTEGLLEIIQKKLEEKGYLVKDLLDV